MKSRNANKLSLRSAKKAIILILCVILFLQMIPNFSVHAEQYDLKTVRVGWYQSNMFQSGRSDTEEKSGYSYDYLQAVSDYTGWNYEYVYRDWNELLEMLENGEIDVLAGVSPTEERMPKMLFPDTEMGTEEYYLCKKYGDISILADNLNSLDGKKIGLIKNNLMSKYAEEWIEEKGLNIKVIYYEGFDDVNEAFEKGDIDLMTSTYDGAATENEITVVAKTGEEPYYLAVSKSREDLLEELNSALSIMFSINPYILEDLRYKNYGSETSGFEITAGEAKWLREHPTIKVGYIDDYLPYSDLDSNGEVDGLVKDALNSIFDILDIADTPELEYIGFSSYEEIAAALQNDEIDLAFPITNNSWRLEQDGVDASSEVVSDSGTLFYKSISNKNDVKKLAVNKNNELQIEYTVNVYPDAELVYYDDIEQCLDGVLDGEADGTIMDTLRVQYVTSKSKYSSLAYIQLSTGTGKCFGVKHGNTELLLLLNRSVKLLGASYGVDYSYQYIASFYSYSFLDFIKANLLVIAIILGIIVAIVIILLIRGIRKKELQLKEKEELKKLAEAASEAKSMFLFNMSHDIRTPMNAVLGFTELMEKELDEPEKLKDHLGKVKQSGKYLLSLINNVLEVARIDSGKETLDENIMNVADVSYLTMFENDIRNKRLELKKELDVKHRYVYADKQKVQEIILNLLSNAIKYTPEGGSICVSLREIPCEKQGYGTYTVDVSDTGIGMTEEFKEQIFDSFTRERNSTESKVMGTGLGMSIVKKLVDLMNGTVSVETAPGKGSTFTVTVDLRIVENYEEFLESDGDENGIEELDLSGKRILLAEDNDLNAEIAVTLLEETGAHVDVAKDGVECVDMVLEADENTYDMILMDIQMPNLNGYGAAKRIRNLDNKNKSSIPIIAMTANVFDEDIKAAHEAGMNGHLPKPIDVKALRKVLAEIFKIS